MFAGETEFTSSAMICLGVQLHIGSFVAASASIIDSNDPQRHQNLFGVGLDTQMAAEAIESLLYTLSLNMDANKDDSLKKKASKQYDLQTDRISCKQNNVTNIAQEMSIFLDEHPQNQQISLRSKWRIQKISIFGVKNRVMGRVKRKRFRKKPACVMSISMDGKYLARESKNGVVCVVTISLVHARLYDDQLSPLGIHWKATRLEEVEVESDTYISENMIEESIVELKDSQCHSSKAVVDNANQRRFDQIIVDSVSNIEMIEANANLFDHCEIGVVEFQYVGFMNDRTSKLMFCGKSDGAYLQKRHSAFHTERAETGSELDAFNLHSPGLLNKRGTQIQKFNLHSSGLPTRKGIRIQKHLKDWFWLFLELHKGNCEVASLDDAKKRFQSLIFEDKNLIRGKYCYISKYSLAISVMNDTRGTESVKLKLVWLSRLAVSG